MWQIKALQKVNILFKRLALCFQVVHLLVLFIVVGFHFIQWSVILLCRVLLLCAVMLQRFTRSDCAEMGRRFWKPLGMSAVVCQMINHVVALIPPQNMTLPFTLIGDRWWSWRTWWRNAVLHIEMYFSSLDVQNCVWRAEFWWSPEFDCNSSEACFENWHEKLVFLNTWIVEKF